MLSCCLKGRKNIKSKTTKVVRIENGRIILLSKYKVCDSKTSKFSGLLSSSGVKTPLSKISLVCLLLF